MFSEFVSFFKAQSYNKLQYEVDVVTIDDAGVPAINSPTAGAYIPLPSNITQYANGKYGWAFNTAWSLHGVVAQAAAYLDLHNFDWTPYTQDGVIQNVIIMSAGTDYRYAENIAVNAASNYLLSTSYSGSQYHVPSGAVLNAYTFCSEHTQYLGTTPLQMAQLGQCIHEFGHGLGIPDLYDISSQSTGSGYFDLMGYGLYANAPDGSKPVGLGAWSKFALGWTTPQEITTSTQVTLGPCSSSASNFLKIYPNSSTSSFYLVENRQSIDTWDKNFGTQLSNGIVIWEVNPDDAEYFKYWNTINSLPSPYLSFPIPSKPSIVVREMDGNQAMSSISSNGLDYGSSADVWQVGRSFSLPGSNFRIVIVAVDDVTHSYTISVNVPSSASSSPTFAPPLPSSGNNRPPSSASKPSSPSTPSPTPSPSSSTPSPSDATQDPSASPALSTSSNEEGEYGIQDAIQQDNASPSLTPSFVLISVLSLSFLYLL
jgi:M6 family metalloprotease-like protein